LDFDSPITENLLVINQNDLAVTLSFSCFRVEANGIVTTTGMFRKRNETGREQRIGKVLVV